jgi:hypothetical protein
MEITYYINNVYGAELLYPASQDAHMVCRLSGRKTLTPDAIATLKAYGIDCQEVLRPRQMNSVYWPSRG